MKKIALLLTLLFCICICVFPSSLLQEKTGDSSSFTFVLPASLVTIWDEAFGSTAAETVILPDSLVVIGERAFADNLNLKEITIPESVNYIGDQAFEGVFGLTIRGAEDSYAARWAQAHDIAFSTAETALNWIEAPGKRLCNSFIAALNCLCVCPAVSLRRRRRILDMWRSMRPQDRAELYPIDYRFP